MTETHNSDFRREEKKRVEELRAKTRLELNSLEAKVKALSEELSCYEAVIRALDGNHDAPRQDTSTAGIKRRLSRAKQLTVIERLLAENGEEFSVEELRKRYLNQTGRPLREPTLQAAKEEPRFVFSNGNVGLAHKESARSE